MSKKPINEKLEQRILKLEQDETGDTAAGEQKKIQQHY